MDTHTNIHPPSTSDASSNASTVKDHFIKGIEQLSDTSDSMEPDVGDLFVQYQSGFHRCSKLLFRRTRRFIVHDVWFPGRAQSFDSMCDDVVTAVLRFMIWRCMI
uniref:Uncharacterized protein n=1 Tax=Rhodnius prolixus TaxID=13249 RepID=T1I542_RHOPR